MSTHATVPDRPLAVGDQAPNFDLTSTGDVVLMLCDEVPRTAVVLYGFVALGARARADLGALAARSTALAARHAKVLAVSAAPLPELKGVQTELDLPFPLLHDDRGFLGVYGVTAEAPGLYLVDRAQRLAWVAPALSSGVAAALPEIEAAIAKLLGPTSGVPRSVLNRLVQRRVR